MWQRWKSSQCDFLKLLTFLYEKESCHTRISQSSSTVGCQVEVSVWGVVRKFSSSLFVRFLYGTFSQHDERLNSHPHHVDLTKLQKVTQHFCFLISPDLFMFIAKKRDCFSRFSHNFFPLLLKNKKKLYEKTTQAIKHKHGKTLTDFIWAVDGECERILNA